MANRIKVAFLACVSFMCAFGTLGCKDDKPKDTKVDTCDELEDYLVDECGFTNEEVADAAGACAMMEQALGDDTIGTFVDCAYSKECSTWQDQTSIQAAGTECLTVAASELPIGQGAEDLISDLCGYYGTCEGIPAVACEFGIEAAGIKPLFALVNDPMAALVSECVPEPVECDMTEQEILNTCLSTQLAPLGFDIPELPFFGDTESGDTGQYDTATSDQVDTSDTDTQEAETDSQETDSGTHDTATSDSDSVDTDSVDTDSI